MPKFGGFQTVSEINRGALATVWSARRDGEDATGAPRYVVKACKPDIDIAGEEQAALAVKLFLEQADLQQRVGKEARDSWAPIEAVARTTADDGWGGSGSGGEGGAYYVTDLYAWSLERLITRRIDLTTAALVKYARGIIQGLASLKKVAGRPHGNLNPGNVLLAGEGEPEELSVRLSDPKPESQLEKADGDASDLRSLGEMLHLLIALQPFRERGGWPIPDSPRWSRLSGGAKWLALCNRLLDPSESQAKATFEEVDGALTAIGADRKRGGKKRLIVQAGAAVLAVIVAGGVAWYMMPSAPPLTPSAPVEFSSNTWKALCDAYASENKLMQLKDELSKSPGVAGDRNRKAEYAAVIPELGTRNFIENIDAFEPRALFKISRDERLSELREKPPAAAQEPDGVKATQAAVQYIDNLKQQIRGEQSALASPLRKAVTDWRAAGWSAPADHVEKVVKDLAAAPFSIDALDSAFDTLKQVQQVEGELAQVVKLAGEITVRSEGDAVLAKFESWAKGRPAEAVKTAGARSLAEAADALNQAEQTGGILKNFVQDTSVPGQQNTVKWSDVCHAQLARDDRYVKLLEGGKVTAATFTAWLDLAKDDRFVQGSDPRLTDVRVSKDRIEILTNFLVKIAGDPRQDSFFEAAMGYVKMAGDDLGIHGTDLGRIALVKEVERVFRQWSDESYNCGTMTAIRTRSAPYAASAEALSDASRAYTKTFRDLNVRFDTAWADPKEESELTAPEIKSAWFTWRGEKPRDLEAVEAFQRLVEVEAIRELLVGLQKALPSAWAGPAGLGEPLRVSFSAAAGKKRSELLSEFLRNHEGDKKWTAAQVTELTRTVDAFTGRLGEYAAEIVELSSLLAQGYGLDEPAGTAPTVERRWGKIASSTDGLHDEGIAVALKPLRDRIGHLKDLLASNKRAELSKEAASALTGNPEAVLTAWRELARLGHAGQLAWPESLEELKSERDMIDGINGLIERLPRSSDEKSVLKRTIEAERRQRWTQFAASAKTPGDIRAAFKDDMIGGDRRFNIKPGDLDVGEAPSAMALLRWKLFDYETVVSKSMSNDDDEKTRVATREFVDAALKIPVSEAEKEKFRVELSAILQLAEEKTEVKPKTEFKELGPGSVRAPGSQDVVWTLSNPPEKDVPPVLTFTNKAGVKLEFIRVEAPPPAPAEEAFYLARTELSIEQFKAIMESAGGWDVMTALMNPPPGKPVASDDRTDSPRAWIPDTPSRGMIRPSVESKSNQNRENRTDWLKWLTSYSTPSGHPYALKFRQAEADINDRRIMLGREPTLQSPMQFISPSAAAAATRLAGCRLPTSAEWKAAAASAPAAVNLRDQAWSEQFTYSKVSLGGSVYGRIEASPAIAPMNDGYLWFMPVEQTGAVSTTFAHMRGNVAEIVLDTAKEWPVASPATLAQEAPKFIRDNAAGLAVIGGSAMGPIDNLDDAFPITDANASGFADKEFQGWPDVGLRLAFGASGAGVKPPSLASKVKLRLDQFAYGTSK